MTPLFTVSSLARLAIVKGRANYQSLVADRGDLIVLRCLTGAFLCQRIAKGIAPSRPSPETKVFWSMLSGGNFLVTNKVVGDCQNHAGGSLELPIIRNKRCAYFAPKRIPKYPSAAFLSISS